MSNYNGSGTLQKSLSISSHFHNQRIDKVLAKSFREHSRTYFQYLFEKNAITLNDSVAKKRHLVKEGDQILITFLPTEECTLEPQDIPLDILFEDEHIIVINKPASMVVHPAVGNPNGTLVNALLYHCKLEKDDSLRPGIVHRLDKDTSGVIVAAKTQHVKDLLTQMFAKREIEKEYIAIAIGTPRELSAFGKITRHPVKRQEMIVTEDKGKDAETHFEVLGSNEHLTLIKAFPKTGRTHQIRVHLKHLNAPVLGDSTYSKSNLHERYNVSRQMLHAKRLRFMHPITQEPMVFEAELPSDMEKLATSLENLQ